MGSGGEKPRKEIRWEFLVDICLFLLPFGADQMGLKHSFVLGITCWALALLVGMRMLWILPWWPRSTKRVIKLVVILAVLSLPSFFMFRLVRGAYYSGFALAHRQVNAPEESSLPTGGSHPYGPKKETPHKFQMQRSSRAQNYPASSPSLVKQSPARQKTLQPSPLNPKGARISPYSGLKKVIGEVNRESKDWVNGVDMCQSKYSMWLAHVEGEGNPPTQSDKGRASRRYVICMMGFMGGFHMEDSMSIRGAVENAIVRMQMPGKEQITPNQASALRRQCEDALTKSQVGPSLENPAPDANDTLRFRPLLDFLTGLLNQLGNYPEGP